MSWIIKSIYPQGGHTVMWNGEPLRFSDQQKALDRAEVLNATEKEYCRRNKREVDSNYIVVQEET